MSYLPGQFHPGFACDCVEILITFAMEQETMRFLRMIALTVIHIDPSIQITLAKLHVYTL